MLAGLLASTLPGSALAQETGLADSPGVFLSEIDILYLSALAFVVGTAMLAATFMLRQRAAMAAENEELTAELHKARVEAEARTALLLTGEERLLIYSGSDVPELLGGLSSLPAVPGEAERFLVFADWMPAEAAARLEQSIRLLRESAATFRFSFDLDEERVIEVSGKTLGGLAIVRFTMLEGLAKELSDLKSARNRAQATIETMQALFDQAPLPIWLRDRNGRLAWVNSAYVASVDATSVAETIDQQAEFLSEQDRLRIAKDLAAGNTFKDKISTVVEADRRNFDVVEATGPLGSAGLAIDVTETEQVRMELHQTIESQSETLDQLTTAVARFDEKTRLTYYNAAFQRLFDLTNAYLETEPDHVALLDHLRTKGILPIEKLNRSEMLEQDLAAYRATEPTESMWHLADGRTLRVIAAPQPRGGATWVFEDITEKLELESQVKATVRLQRETIDYLSEAVAVFGSDGRLRLSNPTFAEMWGFDPAYLFTSPRIQTLPETADVEIAEAKSLSGPNDGSGSTGWQLFSEAVTAFEDTGRDTQTGEITLTDGRIFNYGIVPLPNGQTMLSFSNISEARAAELMLRERNDALEQANQLKNDFVQHVNYELRSPLTNIIGFSALLRSAETGPLNERQSEYLDYISSSTSTLLTIVNDILDLATVDAGIMELDLSEVDIAKTVEQAVDGVRDRMESADVHLKVDVREAGERFLADAHRLTQVLFNLLSNAANFAPAGSEVSLRGWRHDGMLTFEVADAGPGIPSDQIDRMFERFEANPSGGRQSGAGLGLSIVKSFVELHQGSVEVSSMPGKGTAVRCHFPLESMPPEQTKRIAGRYEDAAE
ncbi:PAS domain-containing sensor histidine kinase [Jiella marina]|uniref:PAS domain-containing sensor histidine kinase n=1 Tax=Jiella sp. LLJ827 TaxID=2917712 RepID=UPI0021013D35|nr:PAS domain-containing sensor histidine kinase [Jiella sp. LLJ827]MCQ0987775.1 ATP-binding protein [Jiella sp. LLJ827]